MNWLKITRLRKTIANFLGKKLSSPRGSFQWFIAPSSHFLYWSWSSACKLRSMQPRNDYFVYCKFNCFLLCRYLRAPQFISILFRVKYDNSTKGRQWIKRTKFLISLSLFFSLSTAPFLVNLINFIKTAVTSNDQQWLSY